MTMSKDPSIIELLSRLDLSAQGWVVVDHWSADLSAIGIAARHDLARLVYVSTFSMEPGRFYCECEDPEGRIGAVVAAKCGENVDFETLKLAIESYLGSELEHP